jgi:hypothetical protein
MKDDDVSLCKSLQFPSHQPTFPLTTGVGYADWQRRGCGLGDHPPLGLVVHAVFVHFMFVVVVIADSKL